MILLLLLLSFITIIIILSFCYLWFTCWYLVYLILVLYNRYEKFNVNVHYFGGPNWLFKLQELGQIKEKRKDDAERELWLLGFSFDEWDRGEGMGREVFIWLCLFCVLCYVYIHFTLGSFCTEDPTRCLLLTPWDWLDNLTTGCWSMASVTKGGWTAGGRAVRISSLNTGGLNAAIKCTKVMTHIKNLNA